MKQTRVIDFEKYLLYSMILSMVTYAIPFLRISSKGFAFPIGGLFIPISCFLLFIRLCYTRQFIYNRIFLLSLFLLYLSILLTSFFSVEVEAERIFKLSLFLSLPVLFVGVIVDYNSLKTTLYLIIIIGIFLGIYGFYGYLTGDVGVEGKEYWWWTYARYYGIHYLTSTRNSDINYIAIPLIITLALLFYGNLKSFFVKGFLVAASLMFATGILLSFSRSAWISILVTIIVFLLIIKKRRGTPDQKTKWLFFTIITIALIIISFNILNYFGMYSYFIGKIISIISPEKAGYYLKEMSSNEERIKLLKATFSIIVSNPLGVGPDNLKDSLAAYGFQGYHAENNYLQVLSENGIFGILGFLIFLYYPLGKLFKRIKAGSNNWVDIGMFLTSIFLSMIYIFNVEVYSFYVWIVHSIIWCSMNPKNNNRNGFGF